MIHLLNDSVNSIILGNGLTDPCRSKRTAFLLSQVGELASARFAERTREESAQLESLLARLAGAHALDADLHRDVSGE